MNAIGRKRLLKLADFLDELPREKFDFSQVAKEEGKPMREALKAGKHRCGTVGCALGWAPVAFPRLLEWTRLPKAYASENDARYAVRLRGDTRTVGYSHNGWPETQEAAEKFFGLDASQVGRLFLPYESGLGEYATPKQVARHIRKFVKESERKATAA